MGRVPVQTQTLSILDPTSQLGREIIDGLASEFPDLRWRLFHTTDTDEHLIADIGSQPNVVAPLNDLDELSGSAAVIACRSLDRPRSTSLLDWLTHHPEVALVDASQPGLAGDRALTVLDRAPRRRGQPRWYHLLDPALAAPVRLLQALGSLHPIRAHVTVFRSASGFGSGAVEELAVQAAARLTGLAPASPRVLPAVLAFDLAPAHSSVHQQLARQTADVLPEVELHLQAVETGVFFGHAASFFVTLREAVGERRVRAALRDAGIRLARSNQLVRPSDLVDDDIATCAHLHVADTALRGWLAADGLRLAGAAAVVRITTDAMSF